jgi:L-ascorbate metabolism protein UlaG (beta-lactamase superfamily)
MCGVDCLVSRRRLLGSAVAGVAAGLAGGALAGCSAARLSAPASSAPSPAGSRWVGAPGSSGVTLRWLGNNAWEITFGSTTILVDPWLTRFRTGTYTPAGTRADTPLVSDPAKIDPYVRRAGLILVCHGHYDHLTDVPHIAGSTGARVLGTDSHLNVLRALGAPARQLTAVGGGKRLSFDGYTVDVYPSLHSMTGSPPHVPFPGDLPTVPARPATVADLVEGGTLAYLITIGGRFRVFVLSSANFVPQALAGLRPDLALVPAGNPAAMRDYSAGLMRALGQPTWVLPTHWDDFDLPLGQPARDWGGLGPLRDGIAAASPRSAFIRLDHLETFTP